jgi:hypothetical protein
VRLGEVGRASCVHCVHVRLCVGVCECVTAEAAAEIQPVPVRGEGCWLFALCVCVPECLCDCVC